MTESTGGKPRTVTGMFTDSESIERAYETCVHRGHGIDDVNIVMSDATRHRYFADDRPIMTELARKSAEGGELGGPAGGQIAIAIPILAAVGAALSVSGWGLVVAGPIAAALAGAGAAGLATGLIGAMGDWGIPEERLLHYQKRIHDSGILIGVKARSDEDARQIEREWKANGGSDVHS